MLLKTPLLFRLSKINFHSAVCSVWNNFKRTFFLPALRLSQKNCLYRVHDAVIVEVLSPQAWPATFEVLDVLGRTHQTLRQVLCEGQNEIEFRLGPLPAGTYFIQVKDALNRLAVIHVSKV